MSNSIQSFHESHSHSTSSHRYRSGISGGHHSVDVQKSVESIRLAGADGWKNAWGLSWSLIGQFAVLCIIAFNDFVSYSLLSPFFPGILQEKGVPKLAIGAIWSSLMLAMFVASFLASPIIQKFGQKRAFVASILLLSFSVISFGFVIWIQNSVALVAVSILLRVLNGFATAICEICIFSYIMTDIPESNLGLFFAVKEMFVGIGVLIGAPLGGVLYDNIGFGPTFWVVGSIQFVPSLIVIFCRAPDMVDYGDDENDTVPILNLIGFKWFWLAQLPPILANAVWGAMDTTLQLRSLSFGLLPSDVGLLFFYSAIFYMACSPIAGYLSDRTSPKALIMFGLMWGMMSCLLMGPAPWFFFVPSNYVVIVISLLLIGLANAFCLVPYLVLLNQEIRIPGNKEHAFGSALGISTAIGGCTGPFLGMGLYGSVGYQWMYGIFALIWAAVILSYFFVCVQDMVMFCRKPNNNSDWEKTPLVESLSRDGSFV